jgi:hypothetical protein
MALFVSDKCFEVERILQESRRWHYGRPMNDERRELQTLPGSEGALGSLVFPMDSRDTGTSSKSQAPNPKEAPKSKHQNDRPFELDKTSAMAGRPGCAERPFGFGTWSFFELGAWSFAISSLKTARKRALAHNRLASGRVSKYCCATKEAVRR